MSASRTLVDGVDPVTTTVCLGHRLTILGGVTLDLGGSTIRGAVTPNSVGIRSFGEGDFTIRNGTVARFETGLHITGDSVQVEGVQAQDNPLDGIVAGGVFEASVTHSAALRNGATGIVARRVSTSRAAGNGADGVVARGGADPAGIRDVVSRDNGGRGVVFSGDGAVSGTLAENNRGDGYFIGGEHLSVVNRKAVANGGHGFHIHGFANFFDFFGLQTSRNGGFGLVVPNKPSWALDNHCDGDALGDSDPPGL